MRYVPELVRKISAGNGQATYKCLCLYFLQGRWQANIHELRTVREGSMLIVFREVLDVVCNFHELCAQCVWPLSPGSPVGCPTNRSRPVRGRSSCSSLAHLSIAYGPITAPSAISLVLPLMMPTFSRAQHSENSKQDTARHFFHRECKSTLKGRILHCNNRVRELDSLW